MPIRTPRRPAGAAEAFKGGLNLFLAGPDMDRRRKHHADIGGAPELPGLVARSAQTAEADLRKIALSAPGASAESYPGPSLAGR